MTKEEAIKLIDDRMCFGRGKWSEHHKPEIDIYWQAGEMAIKALEAEPHWIPVTKDTPKEAGTYMCTCYDAGRRIVTLAKWQPRTKTWNLTGARAYWKVIAWCKPFEPYKGVTI